MPKKGPIVDHLTPKAAGSSVPTTLLSQQLWQPKPWPSFSPDTTDRSFDRRTEEGLEAWVQWSYCTQAFDGNGNFIGFQRLKTHLISRPCPHVKPEKIRQTVDKLRGNPNLRYAFPLMEKNCNQPMMREIRTIKRTEAIRNMPAQSTVSSFTSVPSVLSQRETQMQDVAAATLGQSTDENAEEDPVDDLLARQLSQMHQDNDNSEKEPSDSNSDNGRGSNSYSTRKQPEIGDMQPDFDAMEVLLTSSGPAHERDYYHAAAQHAPLLDESLVRDAATRSDLPQYGLMGTHDQNIHNPRSKLFLNTNVPFSAFVCGVQGSGKSHTTSCILENCLIPSKNIGVLREPLSALVFSYGLFTGNGAGFSISEAAFLGMQNPKISNAHAKKIKVLVCETNFKKISKLYERLPNVTVSCFKLNPRNLDIGQHLSINI